VYPSFEEDVGTWGLRILAGYCVHVFAVRAARAECAVTSFYTVSDDLVFVRAYILVLFPLCAGIGVGVMMGWFKGLKDAEHLSGTYGRGSVYKGTFATFSHIQCVCVCACVSMRICACAHMSAYVYDHASVHAYAQRSGVNTSRVRSLQVVLKATWSNRTKRCCKRLLFLPSLIQSIPTRVARSSLLDAWLLASSFVSGGSRCFIGFGADANWEYRGNLSRDQYSPGLNVFSTS